MDTKKDIQMDIKKEIKMDTKKDIKMDTKKNINCGKRFICSRQGLTCGYLCSFGRTCNETKIIIPHHCSPGSTRILL